MLNPHFDIPFRFTGNNSLMTNQLILSGNEITDAKRVAALSWPNNQNVGSTDGLVVPAGIAVWRAGTNLQPYAQCRITDWWASDGTLTVDPTVPAPFSPQSLKGVGGAGIATSGSIATGATQGMTCCGSMYFKGTAGNQYSTWITLTNSDSTYTTSPAAINFVGTGNWQLVITALVVVDVGKTANTMTMYIQAVAAETMHAAHAMLEANQSYVSPYIPTDGGSSTRPAALISIPSTLFTSQQGWFATRTRPGFDSANSGTAGVSNRTFFRWHNDDLNRVNGHFDTSSKTWRLARGVNGVITGINWSPVSFVRNTPTTIVWQWTPTQIGISVDGAPMIWVPCSTNPVLTNPLAYIGGIAGEPGWEANSDFIWTACGKGVLTDADVLAMSVIGNSIPNAGLFKSNAMLSAIMSMATSTYTTVQGNQSSAVVEQNSFQEIANCVETIIRTPLGFRDDTPDFGFPDLTMLEQPVINKDIVELVQSQEPRSSVLMSENPDMLDVLIDRITVEVS